MIFGLRFSAADGSFVAAGKYFRQGRGGPGSSGEGTGHGGNSGGSSGNSGNGGNGGNSRGARGQGYGGGSVAGRAGTGRGQRGNGGNRRSRPGQRDTVTAQRSANALSNTDNSAYGGFTESFLSNERDHPGRLGEIARASQRDRGVRTGSSRPTSTAIGDKISQTLDSIGPIGYGPKGHATRSALQRSRTHGENLSPFAGIGLGTIAGAINPYAGLAVGAYSAYKSRHSTDVVDTALGFTGPVGGLVSAIRGVDKRDVNQQRALDTAVNPQAPSNPDSVGTTPSSRSKTQISSPVARAATPQARLSIQQQPASVGRVNQYAPVGTPRSASVGRVNQYAPSPRSTGTIDRSAGPRSDLGVSNQNALNRARSNQVTPDSVGPADFGVTPDSPAPTFAAPKSRTKTNVSNAFDNNIDPYTGEDITDANAAYGLQAAELASVVSGVGVVGQLARTVGKSAVGAGISGYNAAIGTFTKGVNAAKVGRTTASSAHAAKGVAQFGASYGTVAAGSALQSVGRVAGTKTAQVAGGAIIGGQKAASVAKGATAAKGSLSKTGTSARANTAQQAANPARSALSAPAVAAVASPAVIGSSNEAIAAPSSPGRTPGTGRRDSVSPGASTSSQTSRAPGTPDSVGSRVGNKSPSAPVAVASTRTNTPPSAISTPAPIEGVPSIPGNPDSVSPGNQTGNPVVTNPDGTEVEILPDGRRVPIRPRLPSPALPIRRNPNQYYRRRSSGGAFGIQPNQNKRKS